MINLNILKEIRTALKLTQADLAKGLGISRSQVTNIERGVRNMTERIERDLTTYFGVNPEWLKSQSGNILVDKYKSFELTEEEREFTDLYETLDPDSKQLILEMMKKIVSK